MRTWHRRVVQVMVGLLLVAVSACAPAGGNGPGFDLVGTRWRLTSYGEPGSETPVIEGAEVTLQFQEGGHPRAGIWQPGQMTQGAIGGQLRLREVA